ncbi:metallophosphoesterase [Segetibacter koreensis]|uniref:metallophosphoesterase n=1 Tax=Segetibacter koreensis TaxID=398037 RepID=UPI000365B8DE|nr:metallophosphoesterase [Segetibacter koreensis]
MKYIFYLLFILSSYHSYSQSVTRGPYLNVATENSIIIRWKTNTATDSKVSFGTTAGKLDRSIIVDSLTSEHIVQLSGLATNTKYYYSIGSTSQTLQGDTDNYFKTAPAVGSNQKVRILAMGDMGNNSTNQKSVRDAYISYNKNSLTDIWMLLGDNAYEKGTESNYNTNFFGVYQQKISKNHVLWPAPGNHDYADNASRQADHNIAYYNVFSLPANAEAGGVASNTEAYYSYNYANIHFVSLDSYGWESGSTRLYDTLGAQVKWLKQDLAANTQPWTVVYFHHPPFTKGSHDSDAEPELIKMRQNLVRILERFKVDLVLNGHSHSYERSYLLNGFYGSSATFNESTDALNSASGKYDGTNNSCLYIKNLTEARNGIVYAVVGSSGKLDESSPGYPHKAMSYSNITVGGALVIEIENNRLDAKWIGSDGVVHDNFTMMKQVNKVTDTTALTASGITLTASWIGSYKWSTGETTRSITISPSANTVYTVKDNLNCLADKFNITVPYQNFKLKATPNPASTEFVLKIESPETSNVNILVTDIHGRKVHHGIGTVSQNYTFGRNFLSGVYIVHVSQGKNVQTLKVVKNNLE